MTARKAKAGRAAEVAPPVRLTAAEAALYLGGIGLQGTARLTARSVIAMSSRGDLPARRLAGRLLFDRDDLDAYLARALVQPGGAS